MLAAADATGNILLQLPAGVVGRTAVPDCFRPHPSPMHKTIAFAIPWLAGSLAAQPPPPPTCLDAEVRWGLPMFSESTATYSRLAGARVTDDSELDLVAIRTSAGGKQVVYFPGPMRHATRLVVAEDVVDAVALATGGARDPIVVLTDTELAAHRCPSAGNELEQVSSLSSWAGVTSLHAGELADGTPVVLGIGANGTALLRATWDGSELDALASLTVPQGITRIATMNWDGAGEVELVVQAGSWLYVLRWSDLVGQAAFPFDDTHVFRFTVSRGTGTSQHDRDLLACYGWYQGQYQLLGVAGGTVPLLALVPMPAGFVASDLTAGELDGPNASPRLDEILLACGGDTTGQHAKVLVVRRVDTTSMMSASLEVAEMVQGTALPDAPIAAVAAADFDGDGDGDLIGVQSAAQIMQVFAGDAAPRTRVESELALDSSAGCSPLRLVAACPLPNGWQSLAGTGETLRLEFTGWFRKGAAAPYELEATLVDAVTLDPGSPVDGVEVDLQRAQWGDLDLTEWAVEVHTRLVVVGPGGQRRLLAPWVTHFALDSSVRDARKSWWEIASTGTDGDGDPTDPNTGGGTSDPPSSGPPRTP